MFVVCDARLTAQLVRANTLPNVMVLWKKSFSLCEQIWKVYLTSPTWTSPHFEKRINSDWTFFHEKFNLKQDAIIFTTKVDLSQLYSEEKGFEGQSMQI